MRNTLRHLLFEQAGFSPRQLFAALQGAWYEPSVDTTYQESTGITPGALGSTVGLLLDRSQGLVLGPELLGTGVTAIVGTATAATYNTSTGAGTCFRNDLSNQSYVMFTGLNNSAIYRVTVTNTGVNNLGFRFGSFAANAQTISPGQTVTVNAYPVGAAFTVTSAGAAGAFTVVSLRQILGNHATQATAANRPLLTTDASGKVLLRHDATDVLTASLPAINVRRNLLTWSEDFSNAAWTKTDVTVIPNTALAPDGTATADKLVANSGTTNGNAFQVPAYTYGATASNSVYAKAGDWSWVTLSIRGTDGVGEEKNAWFDLATGQLGTVSAGATATIKAEANGYYRCTITATVTAGGSTSRIRAYPTNADNTYSTGNGSSGIYVWGAQAENGAVTPYQKITDWTSEAYSSSGSTYFATNVGMSALHNQSIGATYNLPALNADIYGWAILPERLSAVQESRLERYMLRLANLPEPDYLLDSSDNQLTADDGTELLLRA